MMKTALAAIAVWIGLAQVGMAQVATAGKGGGPVSGFDTRLYGQLAQGAGNVFVSPASIRSTLAMTLAGARGTTAREMAQVLEVADATAAGAQYQVLAKQIDALQSTGAMKLSIASSLWGQQGESFEPAFLQQLRQDYGSELLQADYRSAPETARQKINQWVSDKTQQRISELLSGGSIRPDTELVLVNAIYLKAAWQEPFALRMTVDGDFTTATGQSVKARMMRNVISAMYAEDAQTQMVELPYRGGSVVMLILLPKQNAKLRQVEESLPETLRSLQGTARTRRVSISLPRFTMRYQADLVEPLAKLGMSLAFSTRADFSGMRQGGRLRISNVVHQASVDLDEQGTEATGATAIVMRPTAVMPVEKPVSFVADHPFVFAIIEKTTGTALFVGRLTDPTAK